MIGLDTSAIIDIFRGEEKTFSGNFRTNSFFNNLEMTTDDVSEIDVDVLIKELESKA